jgi:hypothetical protein
MPGGHALRIKRPNLVWGTRVVGIHFGPQASEVEQRGMSFTMGGIYPMMNCLDQIVEYFKDNATTSLTKRGLNVL